MTHPTRPASPSSPRPAAAGSVPTQTGPALPQTGHVGTRAGPAHAVADLSLAALMQQAKARSAGTQSKSMPPRSRLGPAAAGPASPTAEPAWPSVQEARESTLAWVNVAVDDAQRQARSLAALRIEKAVSDGLGVLDLRSRVLQQPPADALPALSTLPDVLQLIPYLELTVDPATLDAMVPTFPQYDKLMTLSCHGVTSAPATVPPGLSRLELDNSPGLVLPSSFEPYQHLAELSLAGCGLQTLPQSMSALEEGCVVDVRHNPLYDVPDQLTFIEFVVKGRADMQRYTRMRAPVGTLTDLQLHEAISDLDNAISELDAEWRRNEIPHGVALFRKVDDQAFLGALVQSENALTPCLDLTRITSRQALCDTLRQLAMSARQRVSSSLNAHVNVRLIADVARALEASPLDELCHTVTLEARAYHGPEKSVISVLGFDPLPDARFCRELLEDTSHALAEEGIDLYFSAHPLAIQKTKHGCAVFALSVAKKLQASEGVLRELHDRVMQDRDSAGITLPLEFYKHATSSSTLDSVQALAGAHTFDTEPINGHAQTLRERTDAGRRAVVHPTTGESLTINMSYMAKRIQFYKRASHVYQQEAQGRGLVLEPGVRPYPETPTSSVLPLLQEAQERAGGRGGAGSSAGTTRAPV